jgi:hypothetical protein
MAELDKSRVLREAAQGAPVFKPPRTAVASQGELTGPKLDDDFLRDLISSRTDETGRMWVKIGAGMALLGIIGSIGTFSRIARKSFSSGIPGNALMTMGGGGPSSMSPVAMMQKQAEALILRDRIEELRKRLKERHPLWYPGDAKP